MLLQSVTKYYKSAKCRYKVLQNVTKVSNFVTKCYTCVKCCYKVLQSVKKCQMLLQSITSSYESVKFSYKVLQIVTKSVTCRYKVLQKCQMLGIIFGRSF